MVVNNSKMSEAELRKCIDIIIDITIPQWEKIDKALDMRRRGYSYDEIFMLCAVAMKELAGLTR